MSQIIDCPNCQVALVPLGENGQGYKCPKCPFTYRSRSAPESKPASAGSATPAGGLPRHLAHEIWPS